MPAPGSQLVSACMESKYEEARRLIIKEKVNTNWKEQDGFTPLMAAAVHHNQNNIVRLLLDNGAQVNCKQNCGGSTALHHAVRFGKDENVKLLIERGAALYMKDIAARTPLDYAKMNYYRWTASILESAIHSTKVIYIASKDLKNDKVTLKDFDENIIILTDDTYYTPEEDVLFEDHPVFTLRDIRHCVNNLSSSSSSNGQFPTNPSSITNRFDFIYYFLLTQRLECWGMNLLHLFAYLPPPLKEEEDVANTTSSTNKNISSSLCTNGYTNTNDMHQSLSTLLTHNPQMISQVDKQGMTPLHHAAITQQQNRSCQYCYDLLLQHSSTDVIFQAIYAGLDWSLLRPIIMTKHMVHILTMEEDESGLLPFMLMAAMDDEGRRTSVSCRSGGSSNRRRSSYSVGDVYELLSMKPEVLKQYDVSSSIQTVKRSYDEATLRACYRRGKRLRILRIE